MCDDEGFGPPNVSDCIQWLDAKYSRHHEFEDKSSADYLRTLKQFKEWAEPQIVQHGADTLLIAQLRFALVDARRYVEYASKYGMSFGGVPATDLLRRIDALKSPATQGINP